jgi:hypothetical protein
LTHPQRAKALGQATDAGRVHVRRDGHVGDVMNFSSAPVDLIPADVPLAFFK